MRNVAISMNTKYIHGKINPIAADINQAFSNVECGNLYARLEIREKTQSKFTKPSPTGGVLCVVLGGWRLISQDREKARVNIKEWLGEANADDLTVFVNKPSKGSQVIAYNGMVVAEVLDTNCINILTDLIKIKDSCSIKTYNKLVNNIFYTYLGAFHDVDVELKLREKKENSADSMHNLIMHIRKKNIDGIRAEYNGVVEEIKRIENNLIEIVKERKELAVKLDLLSRVDDEDGERIRKEINAIMQLSHVTDINVVDSEKKINVHTDDIYIRNANKRYYIGTFRIEIDLGRNNVKFFNNNNPRRSFWGKGCQHPHVSDTGSPCWGNAGSPIRTLLAEGEFLAAVTMMIGYLESVNTSDVAGKNITRWDTVDEEGRVIIKGYDPSNPPKEAVTITCSHCGQSKPMTEFEIRGQGGRNICKECEDKVVRCVDCGDYVDKADAKYDEQTEYHYCDYCYDDLIEKRERAEEQPQEETQETQETQVQEQVQVEISGAGIAINGVPVIEGVVNHTEEVEPTEEGHEEERDDEYEDERANADERCRFCNDPVNDDMWMTCEVCGSQGCSSCISFDGIYKCPNCR